MRPRIDTSTLIAKRVGDLSAAVEGVAVESIGGMPPSPAKIVTSHNLSVIDHVPSELTERVAKLLQSMNPKDALPFLRAIAEKHPARFALLIKNDIIASRIQHTKKIAELCSVFDFKRAERVQGSIGALKRKVFEIVSEYDRGDIHSRMIDNLPDEDDEDESKK